MPIISITSQQSVSRQPVMAELCLQGLCLAYVSVQSVVIKLSHGLSILQKVVQYCECACLDTEEIPGH